MRKPIAEIMVKQKENKTLTVKELRKLQKWKWTEEGIIHSAREHLGAMLNNFSLSDVVSRIGAFGARNFHNILIYSSLGWIGFNATWTQKTEQAETGIIGLGTMLLGLKLAQTQPGLLGVSSSQVVGLGMVAAMMAAGSAKIYARALSQMEPENLVSQPLAQPTREQVLQRLNEDTSRGADRAVELRFNFP